MFRSLRFLLPAGAFIALAGGLVFLVNGFGEASNGGPPDHATIVIHYSRFAPDELEVPAGVPVTITLRNDDPIDHEWIVGTAEVHARHRTGTEPVHAQVPTEVTVPALDRRVTTVTFEAPGEYLYICHLPGHEAYGMVGLLRVVKE